ncbi:bifunctional NAD(P)H-hydrate repair enzyme Nnr [mine drainage metagenome]|uniref:Nicotinamide nucleotide repair protein n=1 Tax=mine drainage metagenome TaxID=410659 RepID=A0A1J5R525_9ZZZZ
MMLRIGDTSVDQSWPVWDESSLRRLERDAAASLAAHTLMRRAGEAVAKLARARFAHARNIVVLCGPGNNGGDGLYAAAELARHGLRVEVSMVACGDPSRWQDRERPADWLWALEQARQAGLRPRGWASSEAVATLRGAELVIDALLGLGLNRPPQGELSEAIAAILASGIPALAVDLPSGLAADTGTAPGAVVRAEVTLTMLGLKPGVLTGPDAHACGELWLDDLDIERVRAVDEPATAITRLGPAAARRGLPRISVAAHKGERGDVRVFGGSPGMTGAARLCAQAALALGAGRVFVALLDPSAPMLDPTHPELMQRQPDALLLQAQSASPHGGSCHVFGPGAGSAPGALRLLQDLIALDAPLVIDADGLNLLAAQPHDGATWQALRRRGHSVWLTPHPREAARLLRWETTRVQADRLHAARELAASSGAHCVLKGAGSVVASATGPIWINSSGNGLLATAGTGDVLAGALAAFLAQTPEADAVAAACAAVWLHGAGADLALAEGASLRAGNLPDWMLRAWERVARPSARHA